MHLFRHYDEVSVDLRGGVIALGNFDGVHLGHQSVIGRALKMARAKNVAAAVMTFEPHPREVFKPDQPPFRLTPLRIKVRLLEEMGLDYLYAQHFDKAFASLTAEQFIQQVLVDGLGVSHVVVGSDYIFGKGRGGDVGMLHKAGAAHGFSVTPVDQQSDDVGLIYSSTQVREHLQAGDPLGATRLLGRPWEIEGRVEAGDQRGRTIGFPTANIPIGEYLHPKKGVYAIRAGVDKGGETIWHPGVANIGSRPTFDKKDILLEAHLFDFQEDIYHQHLRVRLIDFLRPEQKFDGIEALMAQISEDAVKARRILKGPSPLAVDDGW